MPKKADVEKLAREMYEVGSAAWRKSALGAQGSQPWSKAGKHQRIAQIAVAKYVLANFKRKDG